MAVVWSWYRWDLLSNIFFTAWMESIMTMILDIFSMLYAWLIPHLIAKSSALILVMNITWWTILIKRWSHVYIYDIDIAISFLMLASDMTIAVCGKEDNCRLISSSCWKCILLFFSLLDKLKENQSENLSTILEPRLNSRWRGENEEKTLNNLLLELIRCPLAMVFWQFVSILME